MKIVKDVKDITPLAGGSMGDGGGRKKPPTTPNDRDNSEGKDEGGKYQPRKWDERSLNPRQVHFRAGHAESTVGNNPKQGELW